MVIKVSRNWIPDGLPVAFIIKNCVLLLKLWSVKRLISLLKAFESQLKNAFLLIKVYGEVQIAVKASYTVTIL
jgi:hypothetical protein